jgi:alpha-ribazole phosphatase
MKLWLIRHTRPAIEAGLCYGSSDIDVDGGFEAEAQPLLEAIGDAGPAVYSSPLRRCVRLAERIGVPVQDTRLAEMHFGEWELKPWASIDRAALDAWAADPLDWRAPGAETPRELLHRVEAFVRDLAGTTEAEACVVTHGGVLRMLCALLWRQPPERALDIAVPFGSALVVDWNGTARLQSSVGWTPAALPAWVH